MKFPGESRGRKDKDMREVKCDFVSVWENGEYSEPARLDLDTGDVWKEGVPGDSAGVPGEDLGRLLREYVSFGESGNYTVEVCGLCHDHVVGPLSSCGEDSVDEDAGDYGERFGCPVCDGGELVPGWLDSLLYGVLRWRE
jgi:hypothetical protein